MPNSSDIIQKAFAAAQSIGAKTNFCSDFSKVVKFLSANPSYAVNVGDGQLSNEATLQKLAQKMLKGRSKKKPSYPKTAPDQMVKYVLEHYYRIQRGEPLETALESHNRAMSAENIIGTMLEAYIASEAVPLGWIWCSGSIVRAIDFLKPSPSTYTWQMLQIKNRSNSENSSSAAIRDGTQIMKWYRGNARTGSCMWESFPDEQLRGKLSEDGFRKFVMEYLDEF